MDGGCPAWRETACRQTLTRNKGTGHRLRWQRQMIAAYATGRRIFCVGSILIVPA